MRNFSGRKGPSDPGIGAEAAVHGDDHAGDEAGGGFGQQEEQGADELLRLAEPAHGGAVQDLGSAGRRVAGLVEQQGLVLRGDEKAGAMALTRIFALEK